MIAALSEVAPCPASPSWRAIDGACRMILGGLMLDEDLTVVTIDPEVTITKWSNVHTSKELRSVDSCETLSWSKLVAWLSIGATRPPGYARACAGSEPRKYPKGRKEAADLPAWSPAVFAWNPATLEKRRRDEELALHDPEVKPKGIRQIPNVVRVTALAADIDTGSHSIDTIRAAYAGRRAVFHSTRNFTAAKPQWRVVSALSRPMTRAEHVSIWRAERERLMNLGIAVVVDSAAKDPSRLYFSPVVAADGSFVAEALEGEPLDVDDLLERASIAEEQTTLAPRGDRGAPAKGARRRSRTGRDLTPAGRARLYARTFEPSIAGKGGNANGGDTTFVHCMKITRGFDLDVETAYAILSDEYFPRCVPLWSEADARKKVKDSRNDGHMVIGCMLDAPRKNQEPKPMRAVADEEQIAREEALADEEHDDDDGVMEETESEPVSTSRARIAPSALTRSRRTDTGNARRLAALHGSDFRYVMKWNKWIAWDGTRWTVDDSGVHMQRLAKRTARELYHAAAGNEALGKWAIETEKRGRLEAMIHLAKSEPGVAIRHSELDANPWLLNVANGTIDLRTGKLGPHDRKNLATKITGVAFDPQATCPAWDTFLEHTQAGNAEMIGFLQRHAGYCLTGIARDHVMAFLFGPAGTGKSTYFRVQHELLGDYATRAPRSLLFTTRGERHPTELSTLFGARLVTCNEIDEGATFDEALVKDLTGGEKISARRMREDFWEFEPTHKLVIGGNHKPNVRNFDDAIRRRLRLVPYVVKPVHADTGLFEKLRNELPGILSWAVRGCIAWQRDGLGEPAAVRDATNAYQDESDVLGEFFRLHVAFDPDATIARKMIRAAYVEYAEENGITPVGAKRFAAKLRANDVTETSVRIPSGRTADGWRGVRLLTDAERTGA